LISYLRCRINDVDHCMNASIDLSEIRVGGHERNKCYNSQTQCVKFQCQL